MTYPASVINVPSEAAGQKLGTGGTLHSVLHNTVAAELNAVGLYAAKAVKGGEELIVTGTQPSGYAVDLTYGNVHRVTMTGNVTFTFPAAGTILDGRAVSFLLEVIQDATGSRTATFPASVKWLSGSAPVLAAGIGKRNLLSFLSTDDGATWFGAFLGSV